MNVFAEALPATHPRTRPIALSRVVWVAAFLPLCAGVALWVVALPHIDLAKMGQSGLLGVVPLSWYLGLGALVGGAVWSIWATPHVGWRTALYVAAVVLVIYGTIPALTSVPEYAWTYKHIGVIHLIDKLGRVSPNVDIYNRWPGVFALGAALSRVTGVDSLSYAVWVEPLFMAVDAVIVAATARTVMRDARVAGLAALLFVCTNMVGQTYLSPQTLAYTLGLVMMLLVVGQLSGGAERRLRGWLADLIGRIIRRPQAVESFGSSGTISPGVTIALIALLDGIIVVTHQLTPYVLLFQVGALVVLGVTRPWWMVALLGVITVAYLIPNLGYLQAHHELLSGFNPLDNAAVEPGADVHRAGLYGHAASNLSILAGVLSLVGFVTLVWKGRARKAIPLAALLIAPFVILFGQNYGGEAALRVYLFSSPWRDILIASGIAALAPRVRIIITAAIVAGVVSLLLLATLGNAATSVIPAAEVAASRYFYVHAPNRAVLELAGEDFPMRVASRYAVMADTAGGDHAPDLLEDVPSLENHVLGPRDLNTVAVDMLKYSPRAFLVFSTSQSEYAAVFHTTPAHSLERLDRAVGRSRRFRLWYHNSDTRIYELTGETAAAKRGRVEGGYEARRRSGRVRG
jgi:hypothetical protein